MELLKRGEISKGRQISGGIVASTLGFGFGQVIEGRWADTGWIFTFGEAGSIAIFSYGVVDAIGNSNDQKAPWLIIGGILAFGSFKAVDIVDAFSGPGRHNRKYREIRARMGNPTPLIDRVKGGLTLSRTGGFGGVSLTF